MKFRIKSSILQRTVMMLLAMMLTTLGAWADSTFSGGSGTSTDPYQIKTTSDLDQLATDVNGGNEYSGKYFVLTADITYDYSNLSSTQSNYTAIGYYDGTNDRYFKGIFDGQNHTISGIRIYRSGNNSADCFQGLFGQISSNAQVKNIILADARITGSNSTAAIVGCNWSGSKVTDCHALANVTIHAIYSNVSRHGGIVGRNLGTVTRCTSAAALTDADNSSSKVGGIVGDNEGTVTGCIYFGNTPAGKSYVGAIVGHNEGGTVETSYFTDTSIQGKDKNGNTLANANSAVGYNQGGTVSNSGLAHTITLGDNVSLNATATGNGRVIAYGDFALSYNNGSATTIYSTADSEIPLAYNGTPPTGYHLGGYTVKDADNSDVTVNNNKFTMPAKNVTATAAFTGNSYTVTFHANGGTGTMSDQAFTYGTAQQLTANTFTRTGYTFDGWSTTANGEEVYNNNQSVSNLTSTNNGTVDLYAKWSPNIYYIFYNLNGGTNAEGNPEKYTVESETITLSDPTRTGYTFGGWYADENCTGEVTTTIAHGSTDDISLYAKWIVNTYTVTFNANGGTGTAPDNMSFTYGAAQNLTANTFTPPSGKVFARWNTEADGSGTSYASGQSVQDLTTENGANVTLYAQWIDEKYAEPLTLEFPNGGTITVTSPQSGMQYAFEGGEKTTINNNISIPVTAGQKVQFYGKGTSIASYDGTQILCDADFYVYGNIMSLVDETGFVGNTTLTAGHAFHGLFSGNTHLKSHATKELLLPATTLTSKCYWDMFALCSGLTKAPELPATTLAEECYAGMFCDCTNLTKAPALPATTLASSCYGNMFGDCVSLTKAPALPATTLASGCYRNMFYGCTNLTTAPELPATQLAIRCYYSMFHDCTGLTTAPALPATTLASSCYESMFNGCTKLNYIEMTATDISAEDCLLDWVNGVAGTGVFVKNSTTELSTGTSGIPSGWTVVNADPSKTQRYGAVNVYDDGTTKTAVIDGASTEEVSITSDIAADQVLMTRQFTASKPATVMLPFSKTSNVSGAAFYTFGGVSYKDNKWIATMNAVSGTLAANTPYLVVPSATSIAFTGGATLNTTGGGELQTADQGSHWTFKGTYSYREWVTGGANESEIGKVYGFAGVAKDGISVGDFVKVASGAKIRPMGCYLLWSDTQNSARPMNRGAAAAEELPNRITVRLVGANGETTAIGSLDTQTGEMTFDSEAWYTLDGRKLEGKPTKKGIYINNGKKVVIK